ncbi:MAG: ABC transporter ATP-binding protein [Thiohalomonadaceae bacterium]
MGGIVVDGLTVKFRSSARKRLVPVLGKKAPGFVALDNVSFTVTNGERVGIVGRNGAGKSTLLKVISGIYPPHEGRVEVDGDVIPLLELGAGFDPQRSMRENIYLNATLMGLSHAEIRNLEADVIEFTELGDFLYEPVKNLSSGMRSRLGFAIATSLDPEILILDEVFAAGDASFIDKAKQRMYAMIDKCHILLLVSHRLSLIEELCDRVIVIDHGRLLYDGAVAEGIRFYESEIIKESPVEMKQRTKLL